MSEWINELISPFLGEIERKNIPQLRDKSVSEVIEVFDDMGIEHSIINIRCDELKSIQDDFILVKRDNIAQSLLNGEMKLEPILISSDVYIIDGYHRWLACKKAYGESYKMIAILIKLSKVDVLKMFKKVVDIDVDESLKHVIVYSEQFQPFHMGHKYIYENLVNMFGSNDVYIGTSNRFGSSQFSFIQKKRIMHELCDIPHRKIIEVNNLYQPTEILENYDDEKVVYVIAITENDLDYLNQQYFKSYNGKNLKPFSKQGYYIVIPNTQTDRSSQICEVFGSHSHVDGKVEFFKEIYGHYNEEVFDLIVNKLTEHITQVRLTVNDIDDFLINNDLKQILNTTQILSEVSTADQGLVDDGPAFIYRNYEDYKKTSDYIITQIGYTVINYIMKAGENNDFIDYTYRFDIVPVTSFGTAGAQNSKSPEPVSKYKDHISKVAETVGMSIVNWMGAEQSEIDIQVLAPQQYRRNDMMKFYADGGAMSDDHIDKFGKLQESITNEVLDLIMDD